MSYVYALAGNPNCGKTTLFNELTGSNQYVGNWPGVTVEKKEGKLKSHGAEVTVVDLPGIYSLSPYSAEEMVSRNVLLEHGLDAILDVVDATNLERNLYLTLQLMELGLPMVIALNMMDMLKARGLIIDVQRMEHMLGVPIVPIAASRRQGIKELIDRAFHDGAKSIRSEVLPFDEQRLAARTEQLYPDSSYIQHELHERREHHGREYRSSYVMDEIYSADVMEALLRIEKIIEPKCMKTGMSLRWAAVKVMDDDPPTIEALKLTRGEAELINEIVSALETDEMQRDMIIADQKYKFICKVCAECVVHLKKPGELTLSDHIDKVATNKYLAIPAFAGVMALVFYITFGPLGSFLTDQVNVLIERFSVWAESGLNALGASDWAVSLVCNGIITGVGSIVSFFPQILLLFFFLSLLEDSGYMARAAFIMDKLLHKTGLSGRSFVPMLMGFGCSVPGIMAARTLENERDRRLTIMLTPFMSCSAKMPVYALFIAAFFPKYSGLVIFCIYALGLAMAILCASILNKTVLKGGHAPFVMELPPYRLPTFKTLGRHLYDRIKDFAVRAGTILLAASVVIWFLQSFDLSFHLLGEGETGQSILATIGKWISPLFVPLGFGQNWETSVALLSGFVAKEAVVGTLNILLAPANDAAMIASLQGMFTPVAAIAFLVFVLLYAPCVASFSAMRREFRSLKWAAGTITFQTVVAWITAFVVYQFGTLAVNLISTL